MTDTSEHLRAVARGSTATLLGAVLSTVAGFGLVLVVTRGVDPDPAGRFFAASALFVVALAAAGLGTDTGLARFVLRTDEPTAVRRLVVMAAVPVLVAAGGLALALATWWPDTRWLVWALPLAATSDLCLAAVQAHARFRAAVLIERIVRPAAQIVLVTAVVVAGLPGAALALAWGAAYLLSAVLAVRALHRVLRTPRPAVGGGEAVTPRAFWRFTWARGAARIAQVGVQRLDIVLVAWLLSPTDAAIYTVATRFVVFGQLANQAVSSVVQPRFTLILAGAEGDASARRALLSRVFAVTTGWSVLLAWPVYLCVAASPLAYLGWFGPAYTTDDARTVALVMAGGMLVAVASGPVDTLLLMTGRSTRSLANTLVALVIDVGGCLLLVPRMGIAGAALAWAVAVVVRCTLAVVQVRGDIGLLPGRRLLLLAAAVPLGCVGLPLAALQLLGGLSPATWLLAAAVVAVGYAAVVWRLRARLAVDLFLPARRELVPA
ncbi:polysaccharide biosynthesis C-terminal domain-containing protein [Nocardioides sp. QY071]|uniref:lipopolysaccharide biosynthesis protein n=1 Tax=Nocardioides sp. QY071 TaxID=3044187 RepID=UPI00249BCE27|nr:polysaccharide biosynthesis C-terminal domain-containing protein [Nocardioides sp. QY071]WGY02701.1 polysaccharide biosynthesis C-terminal domain-containing protein [Nocardioides sp. QY071]